MPQKTQEETGRVKKKRWPVHLTVYTTPWDRCPKHTLLDLHFNFLIFNPEEPNTPTPAPATLQQCSASAVFSHLSNEILTTCHLRLIKAQMEVTCFQEKINYSLISWAYLKQLQGTGSTPPAAPAQTLQPHRGLKQALLSKSSLLQSRTAWSLFSLLTNLYFFQVCPLTILSQATFGNYLQSFFLSQARYFSLHHSTSCLAQPGLVAPITPTASVFPL